MLEVLDFGYGRLPHAHDTVEAADAEPLVLDRTIPPGEASAHGWPPRLSRTWVALALTFAVGLAAGTVAAHPRVSLPTVASVTAPLDERSHAIGTVQVCEPKDQSVGTTAKPWGGQRLE
jgi:hypothetical protein